jgi:hypothetical protein
MFQNPAPNAGFVPSGAMMAQSMLSSQTAPACGMRGERGAFRSTA